MPRDELKDMIEQATEQLEDFKEKHLARVSLLETQVRDLETLTGRVGFGATPGLNRSGLSPDIQAAMTRWGRTGEFQAALSVGTDPSGGFTVNPEIAAEIYKVERAVDPMMAEATVVPVTKSEWQQIQDRGQLAATGWVAETGARPETATADFGMQSIPNYELYAAPRATQKVLDDSDFNLSDYLVQKTGQAFGEQGGIAFITGNGVSQPHGITVPTAVATGDATRTWGQTEYVPSGAAGAFAASAPADPLIDLVHRMKARYRANGPKWMMNSKTFGAVRKLKDGQGNYLVERDARDGLSYRLLGYPVVENEFMPDIAANSLSIAFADWKSAYVITDRSLNLLRDPFTAKPWVIFYSVRRIGGDVRDFNALKFLKFSVS